MLWAKLNNLIKQRGQVLAISLLVAIVFLGIFESLIRAQSNEVNAQRKLETLTYGNLLRPNLDRDLNALLFLPNGLSSYLNAYHNDIDPKKVNAVLSDLYVRTKNVRNIAIGVGYTVTHIYPIEGNKQALGINYQNVPDQWPALKKAVDTAKGVLAGPVNLVQGGKGLNYRYPVFIDGEFWGIISIVIDIEPFLDTAF